MTSPAVIKRFVLLMILAACLPLAAAAEHDKTLDEADVKLMLERLAKGTLPEKRDMARELVYALDAVPDGPSFTDRELSLKVARRVVDACQELLAKDPQDVGLLGTAAAAWYHLACTEKKENLEQIEHAKELLDRALAVDPDDVFCLFRLAKVAELEGRNFWPEKREVALGHYKRYLELMERVVAFDPDSDVFKVEHAMARVKHADACYHGGQVEFALEVYADVGEQLETLTDEGGRLYMVVWGLVGACMVVGGDHLYEGDLAKAEETYHRCAAVVQRVRERYPENRKIKGASCVASLMLYDISVLRGEYTVALECVDRIRQGRRDGAFVSEPGMLMNTPTFHQRFGMMKPSVKLLMEEDPDTVMGAETCANALFQLGTCALECKEGGTADAYFARSIEMREPHLDAGGQQLKFQQMSTHVHRGRIDEVTERYPEALQHYAAAIQLADEIMKDDHIKPVFRNYIGELRLIVKQTEEKAAEAKREKEPPEAE